MTKTYTKEEKEKIVALAKDIGVNAASKKTGISHQNISRWKSEVEERGEIPGRGRGRPSYPAVIEEQTIMIEKLKAENNYLVKRDRKWRELYDALVKKFINADE